MYNYVYVTVKTVDEGPDIFYFLGVCKSELRNRSWHCMRNWFIKKWVDVSMVTRLARSCMPSIAMLNVHI